MHFVTTDGASEYVAAFKYYGDNYRSLHLSSASDDDFELPNATIGDDDDDDDAGAGCRSNSHQNSNENVSDSESEGADDRDLVVRSLHGADDEARSGSNDRDSNDETFYIYELPN